MVEVPELYAPIAGEALVRMEYAPEVANAMVFLASDESSYTGSESFVDGGFAQV